MTDSGYQAESGVWSRLKSGLVVAVITGLIWLLAESESLRSDKVRVEVQFRTDAATNRLVRVNPDFSGMVTLQLKGPTSKVDALTTALRNPIRLEPGMEGVLATAGEHLVNLEAALRALPLIRDSAVSVLEVDPASVTIIVDELVTRELPVKVVVPEGQTLDGSPEAAPSTTRVTMPEFVARDLPPDTTAIARVDAKELTTLPAGRFGTLNNVPLELPEPIWSTQGVKMDPSQVAVTLRLRSRLDLITVPTIPVQLRMPIDAVGKYELECGTTELKDVAVAGPIDLIGQIKAGKLQPVATVPLTTAELEQAATTGQVLSKEPIFSDIPTPLSFEARQKVVRILVKKRETPPSSVPRG